MFGIQQEMGVELKVFVLRPTYLKSPRATYSLIGLEKT